MEEDLKRIKKKYGESMMHFCRANFSSVLETEGLLPKILESKFVPSRTLYDDIYGCEQEFINIIMKEVKPKEDGHTETIKTAKELLSDAGYDLYECHSEEDIQSFKKYYSKGEELCTFRGERLNSCIVFFAVKKNVSEIKRENFKNPERQDEYGTSVISIQFSRYNHHYLSIKNRYNHTVSNQDATFSNNLENIIPGLTKAFEADYNLKTKVENSYEIPGYVLASDNRYYKNNLEKNNIVYTPNNIIVDNGEVKTYDKELYTVFDYFVLDKKNKKISLYDENLDDSLIDVIGEIDKIEEKKQGEEKEITITNKKGEVTTIKLNENNRIVEFTNNYVKDIGNNFLIFCKELKKIDVPNVESVGESFALSSQLEEFIAPNLRKAGHGFMSYNNSLKALETPALEKVGIWFASDSQVEEFIAPKLRYAKSYFMSKNTSLKVLEIPSLEVAGECFACRSQVEEFIAPKLRYAGEGFMKFNNALKVLEIPALETAGHGFAEYSQVEKLIASKLKYVGDYFMSHSKSLKVLETLALEKAGEGFAEYSQVEEFNAPNLKYAFSSFMRYNNAIKVLEIPALELAGNGFAEYSRVEEFIALRLRKVGEGFMRNNKSLRVLAVSEDCDTTVLPSNVQSKIKRSKSSFGILNISLLKQIKNYRISRQKCKKSDVEKTHNKTKRR